MILSIAWRGIVRKGQAADSPKKQFVDVLNEVIAQQAARGGSTDGAISKFTRFNFIVESAMFVSLLIFMAAVLLGCTGATGVIG